MSARAPSVFTQRSHAIQCPACGVIHDTWKSDVGVHDGVTGDTCTFDCDCGATLYTVTVTLVVVATAQDKAQTHAHRLREKVKALDIVEER